MMGQAALMAGAMVVADKIYAGTIDSAKSHIDGKAGAGDFLTTRSGSTAVTKTEKIYVSGVINPDGSIANQIGKAVRPNMEGGWLSEGSFVGRTLNHIPGMNALAIVHDIWGALWGELHLPTPTFRQCLVQHRYIWSFWQLYASRSNGVRPEWH